MRQATKSNIIFLWKIALSSSETGFVCKLCTTSSYHTPYACNNNGMEEKCVRGDVCIQNLFWFDGNPSSFITTSQCAAKSYCLETHNKLLCNHIIPTHSECVRCCLNSTCGAKVDYEQLKQKSLLLEYTRPSGPLELSMIKPIEGVDLTSPSTQVNKLVQGVQLMLKDIPAGVDVFMIRYEPRDEKSHRVIVKMLMTYFKWANVDSIMSAIKDSLEHPSKGSYLAKNIDSKYAPLVFEIGSAQCPKSTSQTMDGTTMSWPQELAGVTVRQLCQKDLLKTNLIYYYAQRKCGLDGKWGDVDYSRCWQRQTDMELRIMKRTNEKIRVTDGTVNEDSPSDTPTSNTSTTASITTTTVDSNALEISSQIRDFFARKAKDKLTLTAFEIDTRMIKLLKLINKETLDSYPLVGKNILSSFNNIMECLHETLTSPEKIRSAFYKLADSVPVGSTSNFQFLSKNLVFHCRHITAKETRDITALEYTFNNTNKFIALFGDSSKLKKHGPARITIPISAVVKSLNESTKRNMSRLCFWFIEDDTFYDIRQSSRLRRQVKEDDFINSRIVVAYFPGLKIHKLSRNVVMKFRHYSEDPHFVPHCVHWDPNSKKGKGDWSSAGCSVVSTKKKETVCGCNHMTSFAVLSLGGDWTGQPIYTSPNGQSSSVETGKGSGCDSSMKGVSSFLGFVMFITFIVIKLIARKVIN